ncbi:MAG: DNA translocase FtsK 4TM domain-containing protein [Candidatus Komeilibacteria bacterium]|nr:DNA translocase FtsK 4TM domain-containing protein [Candidatus Komeilibacteria bacterium]
MAKKKKKNQPEPLDTSVLSPETKKGISIVVIFLVAFLALLSLLDLAGDFGIQADRLLGIALGWGKWLFPILLLVWGYILVNPDKYLLKPSNYIGLFVAIISGAGLLEIIYNFNASNDLFVAHQGGGYIGHSVAFPLSQIASPLAALLILVALLVIAVLISFNISLDELGNKVNIFRRLWLKLSGRRINRVESYQDDYDYTDEEDEPEESVKKRKKKLVLTEEDNEEEYSASNDESTFVTKNSDLPATSKPPKKRIKVTVPLDLLEGGSSKPQGVDLEINTEKIRRTFEVFGIEVTMADVNVGPTLTQFTLKPAEGVKLSQITNLHNDLALALASHPIRIEAPIPGKSLVGIEVPNKKIATVKLREVLDAPEFKNSDRPLTIALGKDVSGEAKVVDIGAMPHCLIAGATGSGKSVCINGLLISLLYRNSPDDLKLILVDPKRVEMSVYNDIPHLLTPVITEVPQTINALRWAVGEMDRRYKVMQSANKRSLEAYNNSVLVNRLPYIVIVIDELADLMTVAAKEVEAAIIRLAQMARAVGIHLILATQRPSTNVITGLIKANITTRIAFSVASQIDSRTIIDSAGAEKLLGRGDMLFTSAELSKPRRLQGAFLSDNEIKRVTDFWRKQAEPDFNEEITDRQKGINLPGSSLMEDDDELLPEAQEIIIKAGKASASYLQRRLRIGYSRAARLLDLLHERGIIGPAEGSKPRDVLVSQDDLENNLDMREYNDGWEDAPTEDNDDKEVISDELDSDDNSDSVIDDEIDEENTDEDDRQSQK